MKNSELYDAVTKIDEKYVESADLARREPVQCKAGTRKFNLRALTSVAAAVLVAVLIISIISGISVLFVGDGPASPADNNRLTAFPEGEGWILSIPGESNYMETKPGWLNLSFVGLDENYWFKKNSPITISFVVPYLSNMHYGLEFTGAANTFSPIYRTYEVEERQCFDVMFYASPDKNGSLAVRLTQPEGEDTHLQGAFTVYTANSGDYTFISLASMETAMTLAGQKIIQRGDDFSSVYTPGSINDTSGIVKITGTVSYLDDAGERQLVDGAVADVYKFSKDLELISVTTIDVNGGRYSLDLDVDPAASCFIYTRIRNTSASPEPLSVLELKERKNVLINNLPLIRSGGRVKDQFIFGYAESVGR